MFRKFLPFIAIGLWGVFILPPSRASATTPLTKAEIQELRNLVQLMPQSQPKRKAKLRDAMIPGDGLLTGRTSLADLRFNDGSLARVGEEAVFRFLPKTRNFNLSNGTVLLLIPPGQGQTHINTPNAAAAIRGSALFVRYDKNSETTIVGALTNSGIQVFNENASQSQELTAGQLMVIVKGKFQGLYDFDLRTFYETSDLVRGLDLPGRIPSLDPAIAKVQAETSAAVASQKPIIGQGVVENPSFLRSVSSKEEASNNNSRGSNTPQVNTLLETGQVLSNYQNQSNPSRRVDSTSNSLPSVTPPPNTTNNGNQVGQTAQFNPPSVTSDPIRVLNGGNPPPNTLNNGIINPQTPVTPVNNGIINPQTPVTPVNNGSTNPQTPVTPVNNGSTNPQTPVTPVNNGSTNPQTPVTPVNNGSTNPQTPVTPVNNGIINPQTPVTPVNNGIINNPPTQPVTPVNNGSTNPQTPVTPVNNGIINNPSTQPVTQPQPPTTTTPTVTPSKPETPSTPQPATPSTPTSVTPPSTSSPSGNTPGSNPQPQPVRPSS